MRIYHSIILRILRFQDELDYTHLNDSAVLHVNAVSTYL